MWTQELQNGKGTRYKYYERFTDPNTDKVFTLSVVLSSKTRHAKKEATRLLQEKFMKKTANKKETLLQSLTFYEVADMWLEDTKNSVKIETAINHAGYVRRIKKAVPKKLLFSDFTPGMAEKIIHDMYDVENLSYSYCKSTLITLKAIMKSARKSGYIQDIADFLDINLKRRQLTKEERDAKANKFLDQDELENVLTQLKAINPRVALAMEFIALTGLRCGELLALRVQDYKYDKKNKVHYIDVNGTIVNAAANGDTIQRGTPKNDYSYRNVVLNDRANKIISGLILDNRRAASWQQGPYQDHGYIFTNSKGFPYNLQYINRQLRKVNLPGKKISSHIFRHTHVSLLVSMNIPVKTIMARVGHNDPHTTLSIYAHVTKGMQKELTTKLDKLVV